MLIQVVFTHVYIYIYIYIYIFIFIFAFTHVKSWALVGGISTFKLGGPSLLDISKLLTQSTETTHINMSLSFRSLYITEI